MAPKNMKQWSSIRIIWRLRAFDQSQLSYGICLRQRHEDSLALEHFEKAKELLEERITQMGTLQNRHMVEEQCLILKPLQELYTELGHPLDQYPEVGFRLNLTCAARCLSSCGGPSQLLPSLPSMTPSSPPP